MCELSNQNRDFTNCTRCQTVTNEASNYVKLTVFRGACMMHLKKFLNPGAIWSAPVPRRAPGTQEELGSFLGRNPKDLIQTADHHSDTNGFVLRDLSPSLIWRHLEASPVQLQRVSQLSQVPTCRIPSTCCAFQFG